MKRLLVLPLAVLAASCLARAQEALPSDPAANPPVAVGFGGTSTNNVMRTARLTLDALSTPPRIVSSATLASSLAPVSPDASPAPAPEPKFVYGGRDDYRLQLGFSVAWYRFRSSIFNASAVGIKTSLTYFTNEWFGIEGNITPVFAPQIFDREHVKLLVYGAGPKIGRRQHNWEPWLHAIVGGSHEQPQVAGGFSRNSFAVEAGGGADYRFNPRLSGRLEGNWVHTSFFAQTQNNFELNGGVVYHF